MRQRLLTVIHICVVQRIATACLVLLLPWWASGATLQERLEQAIVAFGEGDYTSSYWQFECMELDYGSAPEFLAGPFQQVILPVRGYAALMADRPTDALIYFAELLSQYPPPPGLRAFVLYNAAIAQSQTEALAAAAHTFQTFQLTFPGSNEAALALLQEAKLRFEIGEVEQASTLLDTFYRSDAPEPLRMQARLQALQIASNTGSTRRIREILFDTDWQVTAMPDIAVLSFAALEAGDRLLNDGDYTNAVRAYRLTLPRKILIEKQRERLYAVQHVLAQYSRFASSIWHSHFQQLVARLSSQLKWLETMDDYTPSLYLRTGQAYLLGQRFREATILLRTVAQTAEFAADIRAESHYRWIVALCEAKDWQTARATAELFLNQHSKHPLANHAYFLIAHAYQGEGSFLDAIQILDELIAQFPNDTQAARWYFTRGYNFSVLEQYSQARVDFDTALQRFPDSSLVTQIKLWHALTLFFERDYAASLSALKALQQNSRKHPLYPEIQYRIATVYYAQRTYDQALKAADALIQQFPDHYRMAATQALRGDSQMGLGELLKAVQAFKQVPPDDTALYDYAIFQTVKIYTALERYKLLRQHLQAYIDRDDAPERPRVSEALYWIGWSLQQEGRGAEAFPLFEQALIRFGNDRQARAVGSILSAYANLYKRQRTTDPTLSTVATWLQNATDQSLADGHLTWFARLTLFHSKRLRGTLGDERAEAMLLSIHRFVPLEQQDVETLAGVGLALVKRGYQSADDYWEQILIDYPQHFERGTAYFGKAQLAANAGHLQAARRWLLRFLEETPTHTLAADVRLLSADILTRQGLYEAAEQVLNEVLRIKQMRGRPHARALAGLARMEAAQKNPKRAIPYWQRIYTLYRAYPEILVEAYWESALLFEAIGDYTAARNTMRELLSDERLQGFDTYSAAQQKLSEWDVIVPAHNNRPGPPAQQSTASQP